MHCCRTAEPLAQTHCLCCLQSTHMASETVDEKAVYNNTGNPLPEDISTCAHWLLNEPFTAVFDKLSDMQVMKGLALLDIVQQLHQ